MENTKFCQILLQAFAKKSKAILNLIIALTTNSNAKSVTELALFKLINYLWKFLFLSRMSNFKYDLQEDALDKIFSLFDKS